MSIEQMLAVALVIVFVAVAYMVFSAKRDGYEDDDYG